MNVYFDYQIFYLQKYGGISRYFVELANHLNEIPYCSAKIVAPYHQNEYLLSEGTKLNTYQLNPLLKKLAYNRFVDKRIFLNEQITRFICERNKPTVLHETYYTNRFKVNVPKVITIHDMIYELFSLNSEVEKQIITQKKKAILEADKIIAVSQSTKRDLLSIYPEVEKKVHVIYHGLTPINPSNVNAYQNGRPYILFVGNRDWYKNFEILLEVYSASEKINKTFDLLCLGGLAFTPSELNLINKNGLSSKVKQLKGSDDVMHQLYKGASVLAYLSKYEGFGFPVLEALNFNCPVICANSSSLPEVAGKHAVLIDVTDKHQILQALDTVLYSSQSNAQTKVELKEWVSQFNWNRCASETLEVYKQLL